MPNDNPSTRQDPNIPGRSHEHDGNPPTRRGDERQGVTEAQRELEREVEPLEHEPERRPSDAEITES